MILFVLSLNIRCAGRRHLGTSPKSCFPPPPPCFRVPEPELAFELARSEFSGHALDVVFSPRHGVIDIGPFFS